MVWVVFPIMEWFHTHDQDVQFFSHPGPKKMLSNFLASPQRGLKMFEPTPAQKRVAESWCLCIPFFLPPNMHKLYLSNYHAPLSIIQLWVSPKLWSRPF